MDAASVIEKCLEIPVNYVKETNRKDLVIAAVHRTWLQDLLRIHQLPVFILHETLKADEIKIYLRQGESIGSQWKKIIIKVLKKVDKKVIPLPRSQLDTSKVESPLTFAQLMHYVSQTNYRNLWKDAFKKFYNICGAISNDGKHAPHISLMSSDQVKLDVILRMFGCPIITLDSECFEGVTCEVKGRNYDVHCNVLPVLCAIETKNYYFLIQEPYIQHTLHDCVMFSPAMLGTSYFKPLFVIYQLLQAMKCMHDRGLVMGDIMMDDILIMENLWIQVMPRIEDNIHSIPKSNISSSYYKMGMEIHKGECHTQHLDEEHKNDCDPVFSVSENLQVATMFCCEQCRSNLVLGKLSKNNECSKRNVSKTELQHLSELWVRGQISNFDYLTALNNLAGRRLGDPTNHHVMPWVTDFTLSNGTNWRDMTRSKFRLNKGDRQLDLTYDTATATSQVPHHVSEVLSEITYYVYMSRRTPKSVLCKYVRPKWVPAEYPSSIQRMQEWTPDECIPEFFTDARVFQSIHVDLPDLEIPGWASSAQEFVDKHREALESIYVSERLHHWIDLTFGYKLSGSAAIKSKNVCLQLVDSHMTLTKTGVVQLFTHQHPPRLNPSPYFGKTPPRIFQSFIREKKKLSDRMSEDEGHSSGFEEDEYSTQGMSRSSPLALNRLLSRSRGSLAPFSAPSQDDSSAQTKGNGNLNIQLPKDYNPVSALQSVESLYNFLNKTFNHSPSSLLSETPHVVNAVNYKQVVASRRIHEMQVLGCLIIEVFLAAKIRPLGYTSSLSPEKRLQACRSVLSRFGDCLPRSMRHATCLLLQADEADLHLEGKRPFRYPTVTCQGLPPLSAHQLLQPLLAPSIFPFPKHFTRLYNLLQKFHELSGLIHELELLNHINTAEEIFVDDINQDKVKYFIKKLKILKVNVMTEELSVLLPEMLSVSPENIDIILPYMKELLQDPETSVFAAWNLFDLVAKFLGPKNTTITLLDAILNLYCYGIEECAEFTNKYVKLYHHIFLLQLIVRLGLKVFLDNFVNPLVEAVGGYRDFNPIDCPVNQQRAGRTSQLKSCEYEEVVHNEILSPLDEDSSADSDQPKLQSKDELFPNTNEDTQVEPEVFLFEVEDKLTPPCESEAPLYHLMDHLDLELPQSSADIDDNASLELPLQGECVETVADIEVNAAYSLEEFVDYECPTRESNASYGTELDDLVAEDTEYTMVETESNTAEEYTQPKKYTSQFKISDTSADSVIWLSHRLGPVLTARHLSRNLLRMLALCYLGRENLNMAAPPDSETNCLRITGKYIQGDHNASKVLDCLASIAALYGEQFIVLQYLPHMSELISLCKRKLTSNLEGGLVGCLSLLSHIVPYLSDAVLMDQLQDVILKNILNPVVRLISTTRSTFPSGTTARIAVANKFVDSVYLVALRIGHEMSRRHLAVPLLQRFFLSFDKAYGNQRIDDLSQPKHVDTVRDSPVRSIEEGGGKGVPLAINHTRVRENESADSYSPPLTMGPNGEQPLDENRCLALEELKQVFIPEFSHKTYLPFVRFFGESVMEQSLKNEEFVRQLCFQYEQEIQFAKSSRESHDAVFLSTRLQDNTTNDRGSTGSFGSNVAVVGNRIDLQNDDVQSADATGSTPNIHSNVGDLLNIINKKMENTNRHLRGNWLAYWEHEIGRAEKDLRFNFKQIKLQVFSGHTSNVRTIQALNNENSFLSGSRDKTVKLWSLRSQGDGSAMSQCRWTYTGHRKCVLAVTFIEPLQLAASCDSVVHLWDPFMGSVVAQLDSPRNPPVNVLQSLPAPSPVLLAATTDSTLRLMDSRTCSFVNELKVAQTTTGLIRCIAVGPEGTWVAVGQSSGYLSVLDIRTGALLCSWKGHESEVLQLVAPNSSCVVSSSLDQTVSAWNVLDGRLSFPMKGPTEPVHCLSVYGMELISGTTASRIGVHSSIETDASYISTRLRSDTFKGVLTAMSVLPLNRLLLLGSDTGNISLMC